MPTSTTRAANVEIKIADDTPSPWDTARIGRLCYSFIIPILRKGARTPLQLKDLPPTPRRDRAPKRVAMIQRSWANELAQAARGGRKPSLLYAIIDAHKYDLLRGFTLTSGELITIIAQPLVLRPFIGWLGDEEAAFSTGLIYAAAMIVLTVTQAVMHHANFYNNMRAGWNLRIGMTGVLHAHLLTVSTAALRGKPTDKTPPPQVAALVSSDCQRFENVATVIHYGPLSIASLPVVAAIIAGYVGWLPMVAGVGVMLVVIAVQFYFSTRFKSIRKLTASRTDGRANAASEAFASMLSLKAYGWEGALQQRLFALRRAEAAGIQAANNMRGINIGLYFAAPAASALALFATHRLMNGGSADALHVDAAYASLALLNVLRQTIGKHLRRWTEFLPEALVAVKRMEVFMTLEKAAELDGADNEAAAAAPPTDANVALELEAASFHWAGHASSAASAADHAKDKADPPPPSHGVRGVDVEAQEQGPPPTTGHALSSISLSARRGQLIAVSGPVGCGKSALLQAVLGELQLDTGSMKKTNAPVAYYPQGGWITPGTLRFNITMSEACTDSGPDAAAEEEAKLDDVIRACALLPDIERFANGEDRQGSHRAPHTQCLPHSPPLRVCALILTVAACALCVGGAGTEQELGEKGVNLSGGQQARVSLARACHVDGCALALLDDPLAAVDSHVATWLLENAILGCLVQRRQAAVVLVTHNEAALASADEVIILGEGGVIERRGSPESLGFHKDVQSAVSPAPAPAESAAADGGDKEAAAAAPKPKAVEEQALPAPPLSKKADTTPIATPKGPGLVLPEDRELGMVRMATWLNYARSCGLLHTALVIGMMVGAQGITMAADITLGSVVRGDTLDLFVIFCAGASVLAVLRAVLFYYVTLCASTSLHGRALSSVLSAPMWWFNANPIGRILNRFTGDLNNADEQLSAALFETIQCLLQVIAAIVALSLAVPWLALTLPILLPSAWKWRQFATKSIRELKRLDNITKSPLHARVVQAAASLVALRAYGQEASLRRSFEAKLEANANAWWWWLVCNRGFGFVLDCLSSTFVIMLVIASVVLKGQVSDSITAFALVYALTLSGLIQFMMRQSAMSESFMTSVERLCYFATKLPQEETSTALATPNPAPDAVPATSAALGAVSALYEPSGGVSPTTPVVLTAGTEDGPPGLLSATNNKGGATTSSESRRGEIVFRDLVVRYRPDLPIVLKGVSATIAAGTKVGIVGRTGSGKSSLLLALLRVNCIEGGSICIDGVDAACTPLKKLRKQVAVIPQTPHLFSGTVRFNLDPSGEPRTNAAYGQALKDARLLSQTASEQDVIDFLDSSIDAGGANKSAGECQLLALARALLRDDATVLALDEATANLDHASDDAIQHALHAAGPARGRTTLVIAHRLSSVIDAHTTLVLSAGQIVEHGPTAELLATPGGEFASLVDAAGEQAAASLRALADKAAASHTAYRSMEL